MGNQNQGDDRQAQGGAGQKTNPQDPKLNPERDDENTVQRRTSDEGQGRDQQSASTKRSVGSESESDENSTTGQPDGSKKDATQQSDTSRRGGNP